ncbi:MAG TPA: DUF2066 domain-containing protein [Reyranella sp.]|nr:DUF2066 domain-containing protein [Reyranella sp.]
MPSARRFSTLLALLAVSLGGSAAAQVSNGNSFTIGGINVDITAADAIKARQQGIRDAERQAVKQLVDRMVAPQDRAKVPPLDDAKLDGLIRGVEFANEHASSNHYTATINVVFSAEPVKAWLGEGSISLSETVSRQALVVPLWKGPNGVEPLDSRNPWRDAWLALDTSGSAVPVTVVRGDPADQGAASVESLYVGDVSALSQLDERYRAPLVIVAIVEGDRDKGPLVVSGLRYDAQTGARSELPKLTLTDPAQLGEAAKKLHAGVEADWRSVAVVRRDTQAGMDVTVPIQTLADWVRIRQRLGSVPAVKNIAVRTLESDHADLHLDYYGSAEDLQHTLAQVGLQLAKNADQWQLRLQ